MTNNITKIVIASLLLTSGVLFFFLGGFVPSVDTGKGIVTLPTSSDTPVQNGEELTRITRTTALVTINATVADHSRTMLPIYH
ncbi:MAG: hypothetical protein Q8R70_09625, partial [Methanoregula sp.]|nr:hypothetical protein [Methanoregula sp.]